MFVDALHSVFDATQQPTNQTVTCVQTDFVPLSNLMVEPIEALRKWSNGRAWLATWTSRLLCQPTITAVMTASGTTATDHQQQCAKPEWT